MIRIEGEEVRFNGDGFASVLVIRMALDTIQSGSSLEEFVAKISSYADNADEAFEEYYPQLSEFIQGNKKLLKKQFVGAIQTHAQLIESYKGSGDMSPSTEINRFLRDSGFHSD